MKKALILVVVMIFTSKSFFAQIPVDTPVDLKKLEINSDQFVGKPLSLLLKEIKLPIKNVVGAPGEGIRRSAFFFSFVSYDEYKKFRKKDKFPTTLVVYLKEDFEWFENRKHLEKNKRFEWQKEDEIRYGNLTVYRIELIYENSTLEN